MGCWARSAQDPGPSGQRTATREQSGLGARTQGWSSPVTACPRAQLRRGKRHWVMTSVALTGGLPSDHLLGRTESGLPPCAPEGAAGETEETGRQEAPRGAAQSISVPPRFGEPGSICTQCSAQGFRRGCLLPPGRPGARAQGLIPVTPPGLSSCSTRHPEIIPRRQVGARWGLLGLSAWRSPRWRHGPPAVSEKSSLTPQAPSEAFSGLELCSALGDSLAPPRPQSPRLCWQRVGQLIPERLPVLRLRGSLGLTDIVGLPPSFPPTPHKVASRGSPSSFTSGHPRTGSFPLWV